MHDKRILLPINLANGSFDTLLFAQEMAGEFGVGIRLLNVVSLNIAAGSSVYDDVCQENNRALERLKNLFFGAGTDVSVSVRAGEAAEEILAEAREEQCELIVLSSPKPTLWKRLLGLGTVKAIVRKAPCPTLVLPRIWKTTRHSSNQRGAHVRKALAVRSDDPETERPAGGVLGDFEKEGVPAGAESHIDPVGIALQGAGGVVGVDQCIVEPNLVAIIAAQFEAGGLFVRGINPGARVRHALFATEGLEEIKLPRLRWIGPGGKRLPVDGAGAGLLRRKSDVK